MTFSLKKIAALTLAFAFSCNAIASQTQCEDKEYSIQLLGSGGPISDDQRASSGEIIWWQGKPFMLVDAGGGTYLRFGQSGAKLEDVSLIGITHFHTDHVTDLAAILKNGYFFSQEKKLLLVGPARGGAFPSMTEFFEDLFNSKRGAYAYLSGLHDATDDVKLSVSVKNIDYKSHTPILVYQKNGIKVTALGIPHGDVPCLAYRIQTPKGVIVISADQNGTNKDFIPFAKGADILVMPAAIDENADKTSRFIHATPSVVGKIAAEVNPKILVLNHFMGKSLKLKDKTVEIVKQFYHGEIYSGRDLSCFPLITNNKEQVK